MVVFRVRRKKKLKKLRAPLFFIAFYVSLPRIRARILEDPGRIRNPPCGSGRIRGLRIRTDPQAGLRILPGSGRIRARIRIRIGPESGSGSGCANPVTRVLSVPFILMRERFMRKSVLMKHGSMSLTQNYIIKS